jgi:hypothetical protein
MPEELINRVANSGLVTLNLENFFPPEEVLQFDLKDYLFMELILKEKEFRQALKEHDWEQYRGKHVVVFCSSDAIIPVWAFMLVGAYAAPVAASVFQGSKEEFYKQAFMQALSRLDVSQHEGARIVIKGCSNKPVPPAAYVELTRLLQPFAQSIMYGEPCSTVPIFKRPRTVGA